MDGFMVEFRLDQDANGPGLQQTWPTLSPASVGGLSRHVSRGEWEGHRDVIRGLYLEQGLELKVVMQFLASMCHIYPT